MPLPVAALSALLLLQLVRPVADVRLEGGAPAAAERIGMAASLGRAAPSSAAPLGGREALEPSAGPGDGSPEPAHPDARQEGDARLVPAATGDSAAAPEAPPDRPVDATPVPADLAELQDVVEEVRAERRRLRRARAELELRERGLQALVEQAEERLARMEELAGRLEALLDRVEEDEEARLEGLVALYQAMKPKQAARIFDRLEMPVLLRLARRMRETKLAPIVAAMDPQRARELTTELSAPPDIPRLD